jgi:2-polyprenyl-3-methyl-5-hydroxy-6-metoxy-1,4-benzoquinol methylase
MIRVTSCPVCGATDLVPFAASPLLQDQLHFAQVRCSECDLLIAQPQATADEMERYYRHHYYQERWSDDEGLWQENSRAHERYTLPTLRRLFGGAMDRPRRVLEIGCGYGAMLSALAAAGHRTTGMEPSQKAAAFCRRNGLAIVIGRFPDVPFPAGSFDIVVARHVIEHLSDPKGFVNALVQLAEPGGFIVIETDNAWIAQYAWDRLRHQVRGCIPPFRSSTDHTFVFRPAHLVRLMREAGCAFVRTASFTEKPDHESVHWRLYKGLCRSIDRLTGGGEFLMAVGQRATAGSRP